MQFICNRANELAILGKPYDEGDLIQKILDVLDDGYKAIVYVVNDRETLIYFDELHEKLINKKLSLTHSKSSSTPLPASANLAAPIMTICWVSSNL